MVQRADALLTVAGQVVFESWNCTVCATGEHCLEGSLFLSLQLQLYHGIPLESSVLVRFSIQIVVHHIDSNSLTR
jgi:hypothetical protein